MARSRIRCFHGLTAIAIFLTVFLTVFQNLEFLSVIPNRTHTWNPLVNSNPHPNDSRNITYAGESPMNSSPNRKAVVHAIGGSIYCKGQILMDRLQATLVMHEQLVASGTPFDAHVLLVSRECDLPKMVLTVLEDAGLEVRVIEPIIVPSLLLQKLDEQGQLKQWGGRQGYFQKLAIFGQLRNFDRVLYLDFDLLLLKSLQDIMTLPLSDAPLWAVEEKPELFPEFNTGVLLFDPQRIDFDDMLAHLDDSQLHCGYRADDQSYLCHYFYGKWKQLPRGLNVCYKVLKKHKGFYGNELDWYLFHFTGKKPWEKNCPNNTWVSQWRYLRKKCKACRRLAMVEGAIA